MVQTVSHQTVTEKAWVQSQVRPCGICGGQIWVRTEFSLSTMVMSCHYHYTNAPHPLHSTHLSLTLYNLSS